MAFLPMKKIQVSLTVAPRPGVKIEDFRKLPKRQL